jgi:multimeric flavodoxin WrbA
MGTHASTRVFGIVGSPRPGGNTDTLVDAVLRGAGDEGALTEKVSLSDLVIGPCRACGACEKTGECAQRDDMRGLLERMERSDVWVFGTPIYYWGPSAQFKAFVDRWYGAGKIASFAGKRVILTIALGSGDARVAGHAIGMLRDAIEWQKSILCGTVIAPGVFDKGAVKRHADVLKKAARAGRDAVAAVRGGRGSRTSRIS